MRGTSPRGGVAPFEEAPRAGVDFVLRVEVDLEEVAVERDGGVDAVRAGDAGVFTGAALAGVARAVLGLMGSKEAPLGDARDSRDVRRSREDLVVSRGVVRWTRDFFGGEASPGLGVALEGLAEDVRRAIASFMGVRAPLLHDV